MENNNKLVTATIEIVSADALELRMIGRAEKVEENLNKKTSKQDEKIEKLEEKVTKETERVETAVNAKIELVEVENKELKRQITVLSEAHIQHQNTAAQSNNILHDRLNIQQRDIQDIRLDIRLVNDKLDLLKSDTRNAGAAYAKTFIQKIESAKNVPSHTPEQLQTIIELIGDYQDKVGEKEADIKKKTITVTRWRAMITDAAQEGLLSIAQSGINSSLTIRDCRIKFDELVRDGEGKAQAGQFLDSFVTGMMSEVTTMTISAETAKLAFDAVKMAFSAGKILYKIHKANQVRKEVEEYWKNEVEENMEELISLLSIPTKKFLDTILMFYVMLNASYYGREDVEFETFEGTVYGNKKAPYYRRTFKNIPNYYEDVPEYTAVSMAIKTALKVEKDEGPVKHDIEKFSTFLCNAKNRRVKYLFKSLLAVRELGEFRKNLSGVIPIFGTHGNHKYPLPKTFCGKSSQTTIFMIISSVVLAPVLGFIAVPLAEGVKRRIYHNNTPRLTEYMRKLLINYSSEACDIIIEQLVGLTKLRFYNEGSGCEFGNFCYNLLVDGILDGKIRGKDDEAKSQNKQIFIEAFHLLEKMNNLGVANREIFFDTRIQTRVESHTLSDICSGLSDRFTEMYREALVQSPNPRMIEITNPELANDNSRTTPISTTRMTSESATRHNANRRSHIQHHSRSNNPSIGLTAINDSSRVRANSLS